VGEELVRSDKGRGSNSPCLVGGPPGPPRPLEIIDLSKLGKGTDNSRTGGGGGGGGRVSFDFMRPSRLMEGLNVVMVMALSWLLRRAPPGVGVAGLSAWETFLL
jgi:hypothetical protein